MPPEEQKSSEEEEEPPHIVDFLEEQKTRTEVEKLTDYMNYLDDNQELNKEPELWASSEEGEKMLRGLELPERTDEHKMTWFAS